MANGHYELKKSANGQYHFVLKASNGEIILSSEMYASKASAENGIVSVQSNSLNKEQFEQRISNNDALYFVLKAQNHQVIGTSQMYRSESALKTGIQTVFTHGRASKVDDLSG